MKHSDWLRLKSEGDRICATMRQQGYKYHKQTRRLSWKLCKEDRTITSSLDSQYLSNHVDYLGSQIDQATHQTLFLESPVKFCTEQGSVLAPIALLPNSLLLSLSRQVHPPTAFGLKIAALLVSLAVIVQTCLSFT